MGSGVGACVGAAVGAAVGATVGAAVGDAVGTAVGAMVGAMVGAAVGAEVGGATHPSEHVLPAVHIVSWWDSWVYDSQATQAVMPVVLANVFSGQQTHSDEPSVFAYRPAAQSVRVVALLLAATEPGRHGEHLRR